MSEIMFFVVAFVRAGVVTAAVADVVASVVTVVVVVVAAVVLIDVAVRYNCYIVAAIDNVNEVSFEVVVVDMGIVLLLQLL